MMRKAAIGAAFALLAVYFLNHGVLVWSTTEIREGWRHKTCKYLFITGIATANARGASPSGMEMEFQPDGMYCRIFGD
jgi:hypothetical protein